MKPARSLPSPLDLEEFWDRLRRASRSLLVLDYDGTLSPLQPDRDRAFPWPGVREALAKILSAPAARVVLVSGREAAQAARLLGIQPPPEIWGVHGRERLLPGGKIERAPLAPGQARTLEEAEQALRRAGFEKRVEVKMGSLALHWRGVSREERAALETFAKERLDSLAGRAGLEVRPFDGGVEYRAPGPGKGQALRALKEEAGPGTPLAFLGDDLTDEEGFAALGEEDLAVLVGAPGRPTRARFQILPPEELLAFLKKWAASTAGPL